MHDSVDTHTGPPLELPLALPCRPPIPRWQPFPRAASSFAYVKSNGVKWGSCAVGRLVVVDGPRALPPLVVVLLDSNAVLVPLDRVPPQDVRSTSYQRSPTVTRNCAMSAPLSSNNLHTIERPFTHPADVYQVGRSPCRGEIRRAGPFLATNGDEDGQDNETGDETRSSAARVASGGNFCISRGVHAIPSGTDRRLRAALLRQLLSRLPEQVSELVALRLQVAGVLGGALHDDGHPLDEVKAVALEPDDLLRVVGE